MKWRDLSLRQKIGQTVVSLTVPEQHIADFGSLEAFLARYPIGGLFASGRMEDGRLTGMPKPFREIVADYNRFHPVPLFATVDMEAGSDKDGMLLMPHQMALGATRNEELAFQYGRVIGFEAAAYGANWMFAPNADMNLSPLSPCTNTRALSDNAELNTRLVRQILKGIEHSGVAATIKHFPGCCTGGIDSHLAPVNNRLSRDEWTSTYDKLCHLKSVFNNRGVQADMRRNLWQDELERTSDDYDLILFALSRTMHKPIGPLEFWGGEASSIWTSNTSDKDKTVVVSFGTPYSYRYYQESDMTYINAYAPEPIMQEACVKALFGEIPFAGISPVKLHG